MINELIIFGGFMTLTIITTNYRILNLRRKAMKKLCIVLFLLITATAFGQQKFALVIGNGNYTSFGRLPNALNDANDMKSTLEGLGFTVDIVIDGSRAQMVEGITRLKNRLSVSKNSYGFFFYAGHGLQHNGINYLIPAKADIPNANYLGETSISVQTMLAELNDAGNELNIVVLDACRDFPAAWSRSTNRGLSVVANQPADSIIVYATSAGSVASDGTGRNGLFTSYLLEQLKTQGLTVRDVFDRTGAAVAQASNRQQIPAVYSQYFGTAYLGTKPAANLPLRPNINDEPLPEGLLYEVIGRRSVTITKYIGTDAKVSIPASINGLPVTVIGNSAFDYCENLTSVTIPSSVTTIGESAFWGCSLNDVTIPSSVTTIGMWAFESCLTLTNISVDSKNNAYMSVNGVLFDKSGKILIFCPRGKSGVYTIPSSVTTIGSYAFAKCNNITIYSIPYSVTIIESSAFLSYLRLPNNFSIPSSVTTIRAEAFGMCHSLVSISIYGGDTLSTAPIIESGAFVLCDNLSSVTLSRKARVENGAFGENVRIQYFD